MFGFWKGAKEGGGSGKGADVDTASAKVREHLVFHGRVQGVGFRFTASHIAKSLGLTGWVKNLSDGTVEAELQGRAQRIEDFLLSMQEQPYIRIEHIERAQIPTVPEKAFRVSDYYF